MKAIGPKLVIATHNEGKLREIRELLAPHGIECVGAAERSLPEPEEIGNTVDNAELKRARQPTSAACPRWPTTAGCVDALHGMPGIFSARWAEDEAGNRDFGRAMERWREVEAAGRSGSRCPLTCALSIAWPDGASRASRAGARTPAWPPRGKKGFGYDPIFVANGMDQTFAEIDPAEKHAISHRRGVQRLSPR